jgi:hypothetical protein
LFYKEGNSNQKPAAKKASKKKAPPAPAGIVSPVTSALTKLPPPTPGVATVASLSDWSEGVISSKDFEPMIAPDYVGKSENIPTWARPGLDPITPLKSVSQSMDGK